MTKLKIAGLGAAAASAVEPHIPAIYSRPGAIKVAVVELEHVERTQPGPRSDKEPSVAVRITHAEIPTAEQEHLLRDVLRALYLQRTARGTLDEAAGQAELDTETLRLAGGQLHAIDAAQMRIALRHFGDYARKARNQNNATMASMAADLRTIEHGITAVLEGAGELDFD